MSGGRSALRPPGRLASMDAVERSRARELVGLLGALYRALMAGDREELDRLQTLPAAARLPREVREELVLLRAEAPRSLRAPVHLLIAANRLHQLLAQGPRPAEQLQLDLRLPGTHLPSYGQEAVDGDEDRRRRVGGG